MGRDLVTRGLVVKGDILFGGGGSGILDGEGAPTDGASGTGAGDFGPGSIYIDRTNGIQYSNQGTLAAPSWEPSGGGGGLASAVEVFNETGGDLEFGTLVYISGYDETEGKWNVVEADADASGRRAEYITREQIASGVAGVVHTTWRGVGAGPLDLAGGAEGDPVYLSTTAGQATVTDPTDLDPNGISQIVGYMAVIGTDIVEWAVGSAQQIGTNEIQDEAVTAAKITTATITQNEISATADIARSQLVTETLTPFRVALGDVRVFDAFITFLPSTAATDDMALIGGTHGSAAPQLEGVLATGSATETQKCRFVFSLPAEYVAAGLIRLRVTCNVTQGEGEGTKTIDADVVSNDDDGTVSADINETDPVTIDDTPTGREFTITPTGLAAGDELDVVLTLVVEDGGLDATGEIERIDVLLDVKG